jgi:hypothetical protein
MGSLADLRLPTAEVEVPGTGITLTLRGLSIADASELMRRHGEALNSVYAETIDGQDQLPSAQIIAQTLMKAAPSAVAEIIALANDAPEHADKVAKMPIPVQIEALSEIAILTFHSEAQVGKLVETVILGSGLLTRMVKGLGSPTV